MKHHTKLKTADSMISLMSDDNEAHEKGTNEKSWQEVKEGLDLSEDVEVEENSEIIYDGEPDDIETIFRQLGINEILKENKFQESEINEAIENGVVEATDIDDEGDEEQLDEENQKTIFLSDAPSNSDEISLMSVSNDDDIVSLYKNDRENYSQILAKAKAMCKETSREAEDLTVEIELPPPIETEDSEDQVKTQKNSEDVIKIYDYKSDTVLRFTKPVLVVYFGEIDSQVQSWRDAYVSVFRSLLSDYPTKIKELAEKPEFTTVSFDSQNLRRAIEVSPSLYIEGNRSASEIGRAIGQLLDICNVDYDNVVIRYTSIDAENTPPSLSEIVSSRKTVEKGVVADEETIDISELDNEIYKVIKTKYLNGFPSSSTSAFLITGLSSPCLLSMFIILVMGIPPATHSSAGLDRLETLERYPLYPYWISMNALYPRE